MWGAGSIRDGGCGVRAGSVSETFPSQNRPLGDVLAPRPVQGGRSQVRPGVLHGHELGGRLSQAVVRQGVGRRHGPRGSRRGNRRRERRVGG